MATPPVIDERRVLWLLGAVQFINILEFMMVMPLGPDFTAGLGAQNSDVGLVAAAYTGAAAISGLAGALVLDRFDRRKALFTAMIGLVVGTFLAGLAPTFQTLLVARALAGTFGGPATSLSLSILSDVIPQERRGRALGTLMGAFAVASVLGVPLALELARFGTWRAPFLCVALLGVAVTLASLSALPAMTGHLKERVDDSLFNEARRLLSELAGMAARPIVLASWAASFTLFIGSFVVIPNIAAYVQENLGFPRNYFGLLYMVGGVVSFGVARLVGVIVDRYGATVANSFGVALFIAVLWVGFGTPVSLLPVPVVFTLFFVAMGFRNMSVNAQATRVALPEERARFQSVQSTVQHVAASCAALLSAALVTTLPDGSLEGMTRVVGVAIACNVALVPLVYAVERGLAGRPAEAID